MILPQVPNFDDNRRDLSCPKFFVLHLLQIPVFRTSKKGGEHSFLLSRRIRNCPTPLIVELSDFPRQLRLAVAVTAVRRVPVSGVRIGVAGVGVPRIRIR
mgnify:CR=1 FL=1